MSVPSAPPAAELGAENLGWHAVLDDGRRVVVDHLVLLGRNPQPAPGEETAQLIKIADETRTVSKLHLAIGVDPAGLYVVDRGSTNGSTVTTPGGATRRCVPGETVYVSVGSIVSMGDHWLEIRRGNG
jgi:FHA domain